MKNKLYKYNKNLYSKQTDDEYVNGWRMKIRGYENLPWQGENGDKRNKRKYFVTDKELNFSMKRKKMVHSMSFRFVFVKQGSGFSLFASKIVIRQSIYSYFTLVDLTDK